jgi:hypothetical protein
MEEFIAAHSLLLNTIYMAVSIEPSDRNPSIVEQRLVWDNFVGKYGTRPDFERSIRMKLISFEILLSFIRQELLVDDAQASKRGSPIIPELCLFCTIRYLSGGSYLDIRFLTGISVPSVYRVIWKTMMAIVNCPQISVQFPNTAEEYKQSAFGFQSISTGGCISNCVTVIDGYHLAIQTPPKKEAKNVQSFFSGHYQSYGINIQAACDHNCRFQFIGVAGPGVMCDRDAINESGLGDLINNLPGMYCAIGDCAYLATEHVVPIFGGAQALIARNDNFNFFASQLRIRIEMAFGLMVKKWGILQRPLTHSLKNIKYIVCTIGILHNFCINQRLKGKDEGTIFTPSDYELSPFEEALRDAAATFDLGEITNAMDKNYSLNRIRMVEAINEMQLTRPGRKKPLKRKQSQS